MEILDEVTLTQQEVDSLLEYSHSLPTGKVIGKKWKGYFNVPSKDGKLEPTLLLCEYVVDPDPEFIGIKYSKIIIKKG